MAATESKPAVSRKGGLRRFALLVLAMFVILVAFVAALSYFAGDGGVMPFEYEGMD